MSGVSIYSGVATKRGITGYNGVTEVPGVEGTERREPVFWITGDSISSQHGSFTQLVAGGTSFQLSQYPYWWVQVLMKTGRISEFEQFPDPTTAQRMGMNAGIGGANMVELATRIPATLSQMQTYGGTHLFISIGTNDANSGTTSATMQTRIQAIAATCRAAGITPIFLSILPRNAVDGANDWSNTAGGTTTAQKRAVVQDYNSAMATWCAANGYIWIDTATNFGTDFVATTGFTVDGLHPSAVGADSMSDDILSVIGHLIPARSYVSAYSDTGNLFNGLFTGTSGSTAATGIGTITAPGGGAAVMPDLWRFNRSTSSSTDATVEVVTDDDGYPALEIEWAADGTGNVSEDWRLEYFNAGSINYTGLAVDTMLRIGCECQIVDNASGVFKSIGPRISYSAASAKTGTTISFDAATNQIRDSANGFGIFQSTGNRYLVVNNATTVGNRGVWKYDSATAGVIQLSATKLSFNSGTGAVDTVAQALTDEAAGANITVQNPFITVAVGASTTRLPDFDNRYMAYHAPLLQMPFAANLVPRFVLNIDGTITGTAKIRIRHPFMKTISVKPAVLNALNSDD